MALTNTFCFTCSTRLGSIIIGTLTLIQSAALLIFVVSCWDNLPAVSESFKEWLVLIKVQSQFYNDLAQNPKEFIGALIAFSLALLCSCLLLIFGALQCKVPLIYPFVVVYFIYILGLFHAYIWVAFYVKFKGNGLGDLILYWNVGGFIMLLYFYTWACVVSLIQIIGDLQERLGSKLKQITQVQQHQHHQRNGKIYFTTTDKSSHN